MKHIVSSLLLIVALAAVALPLGGCAVCLPAIQKKMADAGTYVPDDTPSFMCGPRRPRVVQGN